MKLLTKGLTQIAMHSPETFTPPPAPQPKVVTADMLVGRALEVLLDLPVGECVPFQRGENIPEDMFKHAYMKAYRLAKEKGVNYKTARGLGPTEDIVWFMRLS